MPENFGARLRERRERQQIPLATIADQTKIKVSLLEGLERGDVSHWPSGIFRRAFIRTYALAIGLEPDALVREFLELYPDPIEVIATLPAAVAGADAVPASAGPPTRLRYLVGSAIGSLSRLRSGVAHERGTAVEEPVPVPSPAPAQVPTPAIAPAPAPAIAKASFEPDLAAAAHLCTALGRVENTRDAAPLLQEAARILDAVGLIVWVWDPPAAVLRPMLAHGYSDQVLAQLPVVKRDAANATAAAFRSGQTCTVGGTDRVNGALAAPLMTPRGCAGVLALELQDGCEQMGAVRSLVAIFAAQLAGWIATDRPAEIADRRLA